MTLLSASKVDLDRVLEKVDTLSNDALNALPFGMIQLDPGGKILKYNTAEGKLARRNPIEQVGKNFFEDVAPCTKVRTFYGRFTEGVARESLHETFGFTFKFPHGLSQVAITLFYSESTRSVWVLVSNASLPPSAP